MAFSKNRRLADLITVNAQEFITSSHITDTAITHADLHTNMDLTGKTVLVANASTGDSDTTAANTAFVQQELAALVDSAPGTLNTLNELAAALGDDAAFSTTVTNSIATKLPLAGGTVTGNITMGGMMLKPSGDGGTIGFNRNPDNGAHVGDSAKRRFQINGPDDTGGDFLQIQSYNSSGTHQGNINIQDGNVGVGVSPSSSLDIKTANTGSSSDFATKAIITRMPLVSGYNAHIVSGLGFYDNTIHSTDIGYAYNRNSTGGYDLVFSTNNDTNGNPIERMTINADGLVGIGSAAPIKDIDVYNATSHAEVRVGTSGSSDAKVPAFSLNNTGVEWSVATKSDNNLHFRENTQSYATRMLIKSGNGFVGIGGGTALNPRYNLTVAGDNSTAIGIALDNASGSSTLDIAALGNGYANHQAAAGEVWFYSPDNINIGGATGNTNDIKFIADNQINMVIKGNGNVGIGEFTTASNGVPSGVSANLQIHGSANAAGNNQLVLIKNTTTASYNEAAFVGTGRGLDFITNSDAEYDFTAIRWANAAGSRETAIAVVQEDNTTLDSTGQGDVVIQGYDGDRYTETQRFRANGSHVQKGQSRTGGYTSFALISHVYTFDHNNYNTAGTPSNTNEHWLEVPLYSGYSTSQGGGWLEMDICWHASHAQAGHLHSYKIVWGSAHTRVLNISVISSSANCTSASYNPYRFTSSSGLYRHPTAADAYMTKMYVQIKGSTNHSGARSICLRGVAHPIHRNLAPIIDHGGDTTPDGITPSVVSSPITVYG